MVESPGCRPSKRRHPPQRNANMAQIFHRSTNFIARFSLFSAIFLAGLALTGILALARSPYFTRQNISREQPVQFSHKHHAGDDGIDCRYCHTTVEKLAYAGIPPTKTCMNCHSQIWADSPYLEPVRESWRTGNPIKWTRVYDLPDFVYFNHSIHVNKGVGCSTCHGRVDLMPRTYQAASLQMEWCLQCHRQPEMFIRPKSQVFQMDWPPAEWAHSEDMKWHQDVEGTKLVKEYQLKSTAILTSCST